MLHNTHVAFLKFMLNKRFRNKQSMKWFVQDFYDSCAETEVYNRISVKFVLGVACKNVFYKMLNQICCISVVYLSKPLRQFSSDFMHILGLKTNLLLNLIKCNNCPLFILFWLVHSCLAIEINFEVCVFHFLGFSSNLYSSSSTL